jgi:hypothetical protein
MPIYSSVEELAVASDAEVVGTVKGIVAREVDYGTDNQDERAEGSGIPNVFYQVDVSEVLGGTAETSIVVASPDLTTLSVSSETTPLVAGQRVLLFVQEQTSNGAPGISSFDFFYVPVSLDNGVFDILPGGDIRPRLAEAFSPMGEESGA